MIFKIRKSHIFYSILSIPVLLIVSLYILFTGQRFSHYCVKDQCISIITEVNTGIGVLFRTKIYDGKIYTRFFLDSYPYQACPWDTQIFVSKDLVANKIMVYCITDEVYGQSNTNNLNFKPNKFTMHYISPSAPNTPSEPNFIDTQNFSFYVF